MTTHKAQAERPTATNTCQILHRRTHNPSKHTSTIAVVSWRWDGTGRMIGSHNVFCAIYQARKLGIEYLFIDVISIDQRLSGEDLLHQVVNFSIFYRTVQVIAVYDKLGINLLQTFQRLWIFGETQSYKHDQAQIAVLTHLSDYQTAQAMHIFVFANRVQSITSSALGVMLGVHIMACIADLKYIVPIHAHLVQAAYETLRGSDYLLTVAIYCKIGINGWIHVCTKDTVLKDLEFDRYTFQDESTGTILRVSLQDPQNFDTRGIYYLKGFILRIDVSTRRQRYRRAYPL